MGISQMKWICILLQILNTALILLPLFNSTFLSACEFQALYGECFLVKIGPFGYECKCNRFYYLEAANKPLVGVGHEWSFAIIPHVDRSMRALRNRSLFIQPTLVHSPLKLSERRSRVRNAVQYTQQMKKMIDLTINSILNGHIAARLSGMSY